MKHSDTIQIDGLTEILKHSHVSIKKALDAGNQAAAMELLEKCQNCAIGLGESIEAARGERCAAVLLLEDYCELVYEIYRRTAQGDRLNGDQVHNALARKLIEAERSKGSEHI